MCRGWSRHQHSPSPTCRPAQPSWQIHLGNQQPAKERMKLRRLQTADFKLGHGNWQLLLLFDCLSDGRLSQTILKPRSFPPQKPAQPFDALLLSPGLSWDHPPRMKTKVVWSKGKGKDWKLLQYSSMDKSWARGHSTSQTWLEMDRCRLPWSRRLPSRFLEGRCNIKHQLMLETSYLVMETHASSTPVQLCATCLCLPKSKGKKQRHCKKKYCKGRMFGRPFFKTNPQELSTLCIYPENSWTTQRMCQSTKYCLSQILPTFFSCSFEGTSH